jgi:hypothetical protein
MSIVLLHIEECPNWKQTGERLRAALDATGRGAERVEFVLAQNQKQTDRYPFAGSPTILVDGVDLFPGAEVITDLACRVYRTAIGFAGSPTQEQIVEALRRLS